jgi:6-phosphogluconolactonase/glucosamine-6-phosphate isomerase/deaminase
MSQPERPDFSHVRPAGSGLDPYSIDAPRSETPPDLPGVVSVSPDLDTLLDVVTADLLVDAAECVARAGTFHLAVSGGTMVQPIYERLMYDPLCRSFPWEKTHLWLVWEAAVAYDAAGSVFHQIHETFVLHSGINLEHVHPMDALASEGAAVVLALGEGGAVAGYQCGDEQSTSNKALVAFHPATQRLTLTPACIGAAGKVLVVATGSEIQPSIASLAGGGGGPIAMMSPPRGKMKWYLDAAATP